MNRHDAGYVSPSRSTILHPRTGAVASACGTVVLAAVTLSLPSVMLLTSQQAVAQAELELDEIIVTARKREENLLEIPESLTTFSDSIIEQGNINGLEDSSIFLI